MATFNPLTGLMGPSTTGEGLGLELGYSPSLNNDQLGMNWNIPTIAADPSDTYVSGYEPEGYVAPPPDNPVNGLFGMGSTGWDTATGAEPGMMDMLRYTGGQLKGILGDGYQKGEWRDIGGALGELGSNTKGVLGNSQTAQDWGSLSTPERLNTVWGGLQSIGNLYSKYKTYQLGKDQMQMQKDMWNKTWDANKKQFNEAVSARADSRYNTVDNRDKRQTHKDQYSIK